MLHKVQATFLLEILIVAIAALQDYDEFRNGRRTICKTTASRKYVHSRSEK